MSDQITNLIITLSMCGLGGVRVDSWAGGWGRYACIVIPWDKTEVL